MKPKRSRKPRKEGRTEDIRINRFLAQCGLCSRRVADAWVAEGRVSINGRVIKQPGLRVGPEDRVCVDGVPVGPKTRHTYILYNKPRGLICSRKDDRGRPLIYDQLDVPPNVQSVGRLDMDTEGLLLLTDDGELARLLTSPGMRLPREYRARIRGHLSLEELAMLRRGGLDIGRGETSDPWEVIVDAESGSHSWLTLTIHRGRWREVRRTLESLGHPVRRLIRTRFGPLRLDPEMPRNAWRNLTRKEIRQLKRVVHLREA